MRRRKSNPFLGAVAGALGGLAGSWAMVCFNHAIGGGGDRPEDRHPERRQDAMPNDTDGTFSDEPASMQAASAAARPVIGRPLARHEKAVAGPVVHYLFGAAMGAMYGAAAERRPSTTAGAGIPFGVSVWLSADEIGVPLAGFASDPRDYPLSRHAAALASHVIFGLTVECVRGGLRGTREKGQGTRDKEQHR